MKKVASLSALALLMAAGSVYGFTDPGKGVYGSKHDMNMVSGLTKDAQGRVCAFCHTPHHAVVLTGYNPLWSHTPNTALGTPYQSATLNAVINDPLIGPSRLCMSCHDGAIAPDQHYGGLFTGRDTSAASGYGNSILGGDQFGDIAVGLGNDFTNDHPIGFDIVPVIGSDNGGGGKGIRIDVATDRTWYVKANSTDFATNAAGQSSRKISEGLYVDSMFPTQKYMTCATCHDVHNKDNVLNDGTTAVDGNTTDHLVGNQNYFVYAPQNGSQLCLSCHNK